MYFLMDLSVLYVFVLNVFTQLVYLVQRHEQRLDVGMSLLEKIYYYCYEANLSK